ncbi:MAG: peptidoglycan DD-metalloendopeptidase family protein [Candidatus Aminicenantes bacterium]|nr:peptidoglycan DD-metalloendopeptidase family protein [Candidatus Aminicenantes bacterium]
MKNKSISVIIVPHKGGRQRNYSLSLKSLRVLMGISGLSVILLIFFLGDYFIMRGVRSKYKELQIENSNQSQTLQQYKLSMDNLQAKINEFEKYARKINIMAGLRSDQVMTEEPGVGGPDEAQEIIPSNPILDEDLKRLENMNKHAGGIENNLIKLTAFFEDQTIELAQTPSIMPVQGWLTSAFGYRDDPFTGKRAFHAGVDIVTQSGNPIVATADGVVLSTDFDHAGGNTIKISHKHTGYTTVYCHLSKFLVKPGQRVKRGDIIGLVGSTGRSRGPHVHYEVRKGDKRLNPYYYILNW